MPFSYLYIAPSPYFSPLIKTAYVLSCLILCDPMDYSLTLSMAFSRQNTGVGCHSLL